MTWQVCIVYFDMDTEEASAFERHLTRHQQSANDTRIGQQTTAWCRQIPDHMIGIFARSAVQTRIWTPDHAYNSASQIYVAMNQFVCAVTLVARGRFVMLYCLLMCGMDLSGPGLKEPLYWL